MLRAFGAVRWMSTVPEAIVARHMALDVWAFLYHKHGRGISESPINHEEVIETGERVRATFTQLLRRLIATMPNKDGETDRDSC